MPSCSCHSIRDTFFEGDGFVVHANAEHVAVRVATLLTALMTPLEQRVGAWFVPLAAADVLAALVQQLSQADLREVQAAPVVHGHVVPWDVRPLDVWAGRLRSPWFADAARALYFDLQPIVDLRSGGVYGFEALVRAETPERRFGAGELIGAALAHEQLRAFDALARTTAIESAYPVLRGEERLFINFAPGVVYNPDVCLATTFAACRRVGADFSRLVFEVTEAERFPDLDLLRAILTKYRSEGALVALDDLGAGYTSLLYLRDLRPDVVKLDRGLVAGIHADDPRAPLVASLVRFAQSLGIKTIIEGVETPEELAFAISIDADFAQGYFVGRPVAHRSNVTPDALAVLSAARAERTLA